ncbi:hypothetical protein M408DRAFT_184775 [Serendipita vermifera MAFF 305830]|uniref:B30.2/SPRY domain-containing protein n=1 Tax=Serendipita vermifera MAFF 305830 TaxID=933852 RepID=A0A0C3BML8_SERVB|nr:hypothetical protein M408DRAFT_184775 [Serendipita vermifera MAFF 305830]
MPMPHLNESPNVHDDSPSRYISISAQQPSLYEGRQDGGNNGGSDALAVLLPFLFVLSTLLFIMILFLVCVLLLRRRRGISLGDDGGPVDVSRDDVFNDADGGLAGVEERWLDSLGEDIKRGYRQAKLYEAQYPPNSITTDITLSQFLTIQEKGVSAWSFEPEYEALTPVLVHARTELTFLPDPYSSSSVQSNLPIPKLNEVYYWEVKMFDLPSTTNVAVGLATKPYPTFRLPGWNRYSVAYHSNGDKSYNYPFTAAPFGPALREGDVLGVGYRPRQGTVFFTRNGRKTEEAFAGLSRWNLFPTVGADGPCSVHVNLGQAGFVFIEANVKKWGLAPSVGTLAPPPAYGSERGSILLEAGGTNANRPGGGGVSPAGGPGSSLRRSSHRLRRPKAPTSAELPPNSPSSGRNGAPLSPPPPFSPGGDSTRHGIMDRLRVPPRSSSSRSSAAGAGPSTSSNTLAAIPAEEEEETAGDAGSNSSSSQRTARRGTITLTRSPVELERQPSLSALTDTTDPESPYIANPPTPNVSDIHLRTLERTSVDLGRGRPRQHSEESRSSTSGSEESSGSTPGLARTSSEPPGYAVINPHIYASGVHIDLPAEMIQAALDGRPADSSAPSNAARGVRR